MKIRKLDKVLATVDDVRSLTKTSSGMPISESVKDLASVLSHKLPWCLCGGLSVGVHARPRGTDDIDILIPSDSYLLYVYALVSDKFKKSGDHMLEHKRTGVTVDLVTPEFVKVNPVVIQKAIYFAKHGTVAGISMPVVTREGLVALKLNRGKYLDLADIESLLRVGGTVDLFDYPITDKQKKVLEKIEGEIEKENT